MYLFRNMYILTLLPLYVVTYGFGLEFYGYGLGVFYAFMGITSIPGGHLSDLYGRKTLLVIGLLLTATGAALLLPFASMAAVLMATGLAGAGTGLAHPALHAYIADVSKTRMALSYGTVFALSIALSSPGAIIVGWLVDCAATRALGLLMSLCISVFTMLIAATLALLINERRDARPVEPVSLSQNERKVLAAFAGTYMVMGTGAGLTIPFFSMFFLERFAATPSQLGIILTLGIAFIAVGQLVCGYLGDKIDKLRFMVAAMALVVPLSFAIVLAPVLLLSAVFYVARMACANMVWPIWTALFMTHMQQRVRGRAQGIISTLWCFSYMVSVSLGGHVFKQIGGWVFPVTAVLYLGIVSYAAHKLRKVSSEAI